MELASNELIKKMPFSLEAEQSVLGSILIDPECFAEIASQLKSEDFYLDSHAQIYLAMQDLFLQNRTIDVVTLIDSLVKRGVYDSDDDGKKYIKLIAEVVPSAANVKDYAKIVRDKCILRRLIEACGEISESAYSEQEDVSHLLDSAEQQIFSIAAGNETKGFTHIREALLANYEHLKLFPHEGINIFFGKNGSGKTNLLEAVHYCSLGKSHRINQDLNAVRMGQSAARCRILIQGKYARNEIEIRLHPGDDAIKSVWIDQKKVSRLSEMMGVLRCVIFSPEDLGLIKDGPSVRRKFMDMMISQINRNYFIALQQYRIALNQRNAILRQARVEHTQINPMIEDFEIALSKHGEIICQAREKYIRQLASIGNELYRQISSSSEEILTIQYAPSFHVQDNFIKMFCDNLKKSREDDLRLGTTSIGPQRDDLGLFLNKKSLKLFASQGQMRTAALSMKLAQKQMIAFETGEEPVLLLDDVMSELDLNRRMNLIQLIENTQTFITCSDEGDLDESQSNRTYRVSNPAGNGLIESIKMGTEMPVMTFKEPVFL